MDHRNGFRRLAGTLALGFCLAFPLVVNAAEEAANTENPWQCTLHLLDPEGKPVAGGKVIAYQETKEWTREKPVWETYSPVDPREYVSDKNGHVVIRYPEMPAKAFYIEVNAEGFIPLRYVLLENDRPTPDEEIEDIPETFEVHLLPGVPAGGVVCDSDGKPIEGAAVIVQASGDSYEKAGTPRPQDGCFFVLKTDADGKWACHVPPPGKADDANLLLKGIDVEELAGFPDGLVDHLFATVRVTITHPMYAPTKLFCMPKEVRHLLETRGRNPEEDLDAKCVTGTTFDTVLKDTVEVCGCVVDESGKPLAGARLLLRTEVEMDSRRVDCVSGEDGRFVAKSVPPGPVGLYVLHNTCASHMEEMEINGEMCPLRIVMEKHKPVTLTIHDSAGNPVVADVEIEMVRDLERLAYVNMEHEIHTFLASPTESDANGIWTWQTASAQTFRYRISAKGFDTINKILPPGDHRITMKRKCVIVGHVVDVETKKSIERFFVSRKIDKSGLRFFGSEVGWNNGFVAEDSNGKVSFVAGISSDDTTRVVEAPEPKYDAIFIRVEAEGYLPVVSKRIPWTEGPAEVTFELKKAAPVTGRIVDAKGRPVAGAAIAVAGENLPTAVLETDKWIGFRSTKWRSCGEWQRMEGELNAFDVSCDEIRTEEPTPRQPRYARSDEAGRFSLFPQKGPYLLVVAHEKGFVCLPSDRFAPGNDIVLNDWARVEGALKSGGKPAANASIEVSGSIGLDVCPTQLYWNGREAATDAAGRFSIERVPPGEVEISRRPDDDDWISLAEATLAPGETRKFFIAPTRRVHGTVVLPEKLRERVDFAKSFAVILAPGEGYSRSGAMEPDGSFRIADVPSSLEFELMFILRTKDDPAGRIVAEPVQDARKRFTVPAAEKDSHAEPFDLKEVPVEAVSPPNGRP